jgi:hypothetical protein
LNINEHEYLKLVTQAESFTAELKSLKGTTELQGSMQYQDNTVLGKREKEILDFIGSRPGIHQEGVVEHFRRTPGLSRMPILRIIKNLKKDHYIIPRRIVSRHKYGLFVNEDNLLLIVKKELEHIKKQFSILLKELREKFDNKESFRKNNNDTTNKRKLLEQFDKDKKEILSFLHSNIYEKLVSIYMFRALFSWNNEIKDEQTLHKLSQIIISNIMEMQLMYHKFGNMEHVSLSSIYYANEICTDDDDEDKAMQIFKNNGLEREARSLLTALGKSNYRYSSQRRLKADICI